MNRLNRSKDTERPEQNTDSPDGGEPVFLVVGKFRHAHGVNGEIAMEIMTDFPERLSPGKVVYVGESHRPLKIVQVRPKSQLLILSFEEYKDCDQVNVLRNELIYTLVEQLPSLPEGQYYHHQLIGMKVVDQDSSTLGILDEILQTGANDVYVVRSEDGKETLLPAIADVIKQVDLEQKVITVQPPIWF